jgi:prepilin-type N-terminal cleavage/methylation domain-containing protein
MNMSKRPAFTLLELLIAAAIFSGVAVISTSTVTSTVRLQQSEKQSQQIAVQLNQVAQVVHDAVEHASAPDATTPTLQVLELTGGADPYWPSNYNDDLLTVVPLSSDGQGEYLNQHNDRLVICPELQYDDSSPAKVIGKRLVEFTISPYSVVADVTRVSQNNYCSKASLASLFNVSGASVSGPIYLTEPNVLINNFRAWPLWVLPDSPPGGNQSLYDVDPNGIRFEVTGQYSLSNTLTSQQTTEARANSTAFPQIVVRNSAFRTRPDGANKTITYTKP